MQSEGKGRLQFPRVSSNFSKNYNFRFYGDSLNSGYLKSELPFIPLIELSLIELDIYLLGIWLFLLLFNHTSNQFKDYQYFL